MDKFDLKNYLTEGKINEKFFYPGSQTFLNNIYATQEDFDRDESKFEDLIDDLTNVPNTIFGSGNIIGNSEYIFQLKSFLFI